MTDAFDDHGLETFFQAARNARPDPSEALLARIIDDAVQAQPRLEQPRLGSTEPQSQTSRRPGLLSRFNAALGGWRPVTGLATAAMAGVWIGFYTPAPLAGLADTYLGTSLGSQTTVAEDVEFLPDFDDYLTEG